MATQTLVRAQKRFDLSADKNVNYQTFKDSGGRFDLEYPAKDWIELEVGGCTLVILERNDRTATVVIDLAHLTEPLAPAEIATNAQIEVDTLREQQPTAKDFKSEILDSKAGRASLIRYARMGPNGPERVIHYSVAVANDLYRLDAVVPEINLAKLEPIIMHMILSFKVPAGPTSSKN